jgi:xanthine dehydrogenase/oxidase
VEPLVEKNQERKLNSSPRRCNTLYCRIPPCLAIAVAAVKIGRPVRLNLERHIDMSITGHRHPFKIQYKVGFTNEGRFLGLNIQMWNNAGCTLDASNAVMALSMLHMGNTYQFPNMEIHGFVCRTHLPSNTGLSLQKHFKYKIGIICF